MQFCTFGSPDASTILLQPVDANGLESMAQEVQSICDRTSERFTLIAASVDRWNHDLSPWPAPAVFGSEAFGDGAADTLRELLPMCEGSGKHCFIGGYSLAGLFALWAAHQTDRFAGVAAASPSIWFPGFLEYMRSHRISTSAVYLSLGDREEKTRNPVMATVGNCIREGCELLRAQEVRCKLEWNPGNHFKDAPLRTAKAFAWLLNGQSLVSPPAEQSEENPQNDSISVMKERI